MYCLGKHHTNVSSTYLLILTVTFVQAVPTYLQIAMTTVHVKTVLFAQNIIVT